MLSKKQLKRISDLAKKAKQDGLSKDEKKEQYDLRQAYLKQIRQSFKNQLHSVKVIDPEGTDVTPEKIKHEQKRNENN